VSPPDEKTDDSVELVEPTEALREAFVEYVEEFAAAGERSHARDRDDVRSNFAGFVRRLRDHARGVGLPVGFVPQTTYWLVRDGRVLGAAGLRHRLTDALRDVGGHVGYVIRPSERGKGYATRMLAMVLDRARLLGLRHVLVTCDKGNVASARVIQKNGGRLDSESPSPTDGVVKQRYWIDL